MKTYVRWPLMFTLILGVSTIGCTSKKEDLKHPPQETSKPEKSKPKQSPPAPEPQLDPEQLADLPQAPKAPVQGKVTVDGRTTIPQKRGRRVFEKQGSEQRRTMPPQVAPEEVPAVDTSKGVPRMAPPAPAKVENSDVVLEYVSPIAITPAKEHQRLMRKEITEPQAVVSFEELAENPLKVTYLPKGNELENCNAVFQQEVHEVLTGGEEPGGRRFTTGRKDGYMSFLKSLVRCQKPEMKEASLVLAAHILKPTVKVFKGNQKSKDRVVVHFDVVNGEEIESFTLEGHLVDKGSSKQVFSELKQTETTNSRYQFQGKLLCVDEDGACENTLVSLEQLISKTVCKRVYLIHRSGHGRLWANTVQQSTIDSEENRSKKSFMQYVFNTARRADVARENMRTGGNKPLPQIPERQDAMNAIGYSTTAVAYGASFFEVTLYPIKDHRDILVLRGPLYEVEADEEPVAVDFGQRSATLDDISTFIAPLRRAGRARGIGAVKLQYNNGMGALRLDLSFFGVVSPALSLDFGDTVLRPVLPITPRTFIRQKP